MFPKLRIFFSLSLTVYEDNQKVFIKAQVDLNVALGQLLKVRNLSFKLFFSRHLYQLVMETC